MASTIRPHGRRSLRLKIAFVAAIVFAIAALIWLWGEPLSIAALARNELRLRAAHESRPMLTLAAAFVVYVALSTFAMPGGPTALTILYGWLFGFWRTVLVVSFASASGASLAFLLSRYLLGDVVKARYYGRHRQVQAMLARDGAFYLFLMRLSPLAPFSLVNVLMGLTPLRLTTFWCITQLGMLPGTCVYAYTGASVPSLDHFARFGVQGIVSPQLVIALTMLGLFPLAVKKLVEHWKSQRANKPNRSN